MRHTTVHHFFSRTRPHERILALKRYYFVNPSPPKWSSSPSRTVFSVASPLRKPCMTVSVASTASSRIQRQFFVTQGGLALSDAQRDTIYALSTPPGKAGIAVIRLSGPGVLSVWFKLIRSMGEGKTDLAPPGSIPKPWTLQRCQVVHPETGEVLDDGLAVYFKGPKSFTTEDVLELHVHSSRAVITSIMRALSLFQFCRLARPGEFTQRAFIAGRLDLTQVEGLHDLINSNTESQRRMALSATSGHLSIWLETLRRDIISCLGLVEALIDFEQEDIEGGLFTQAKERARHIRQRIADQLVDFQRGEILQHGLRLAIYGPPNAGKSSLFNVLAQREAAIVTNIPGTTRDVLETTIDMGGLPVTVADTAGIRESDDLVEQIGIARATNKVASGDLSLCVVSLSDIKADGSSLSGIPPTISSLIARERSYVLLNKADLQENGSTIDLSDFMARYQVPKCWVVSLTTGDGVRKFLDEFGKELRKRFGFSWQDKSEAPLVSNARHRAHLETSVRFLDSFLGNREEDVVLAAEELRYAARAIEMITGRIDVEDILDVVFRDFCIGK